MKKKPRKRIEPARSRVASRFRELQGLLAKHAKTLLEDRAAGIRCLAIGRKSAKPLEAGVPLEDLCITAYVDRKLPESRLRKGATVAATFSARALGGDTVTRGGLPLADVVDVVECGSAFRPRGGLRVPVAQRGQYGGPLPVLDLRRPHASLKPGLGITNPHLSYPSMLSVGTLGFFVEDERGDLHLVSNNHVIGGGNDAEAGEPVVQPGTLDLTAAELQAWPNETGLVGFFGVAEVSAVVSLRYAAAGSSEVFFNEVDVAMARLRTREGGLRRQTEDAGRLAFSGRLLGTAPGYDLDAEGRFLGEPRVYKVGRTTGYTEGRIVSLGGTAAIDYERRGAPVEQTAYFQGLLVIQASADNGGPFSARGDSGSGILTAGHELAGLLFAGSEIQTLASPIAAVIRELEDAYGQRLRLATA
jgi:hypothetical protein